MITSSLPTNAENLRYDCIVIGSGMGGLTAATLLARVGKKRVLVLERHFKAGGFTHTFRRHEFEWDVGLHYVGEMQTGSLSRRIMDLVTSHRVQWNPLGSPYERFVFPDFIYEVPNSFKAYQAQLCADFPEEKLSIITFLRRIRAAQGWGIRWFVSKCLPTLVGRCLTSLGRPLALKTTDDVLGSIVDPKLKAILAAQWPDMGTPPKSSAFVFQAMVAAHYADGAFYPVGGSGEIAQAAIDLLREWGGDCLVNHPVEEILVEDGRAVGVRVRHKSQTQEYFAPVIISDAGVRTTFLKLVPSDVCMSERVRAERLKPGPSANILFLGLNDNPKTAGFDDANYWIFSDLTHVQQPLEANSPLDIDGVFLSFGSLRDPDRTEHTAQIILFDSQDRWQQYADKPWKRRGEMYEEAKQQLVERLLDYVEERLPGLRQLVKYAELSTPLTVQSFTGHQGGTIYGQPCDRSRVLENSWQCGTSLRNLYLTGADVGMPGIGGAQMAGVMTAAKVLGPLGLPSIMKAAYLGRSA
ncbi:MAG: NAD(P)/FAD-dependent oxidoreductase [Pirellulaceae bacterium]|nr:NAD(P)/FAD-dependent oxidoreductase [Pirellulaceae bacterium]